MANNPVNWIDSKGLTGESSGSGPQTYPGNYNNGCQLYKASGLVNFNMGASDWTWGCKEVCVKESCNPTCPSDKGPWLVNKNSKSCVCVEKKVILYKW